MKKTDRTWNENETTLCLGLYYLYASGVVSFDEGTQSLGAIINRGYAGSCRPKVLHPS